MTGIENTINLKVKVTNLLDQSTVGIIHSMLPSQAVMALRLDSHKTKIINTAFIKSIHVLTPFQKKQHKPAPLQRKPHKIDIRKLEHDLNSALANYDKHDKHRPEKHKHSDKHDKPSHKKEPNATGLRIFDKLQARFGKENVSWLPNDAISIWNEVHVGKPYVLNRVKKSPRADEVKVALKQIWLDVDSHKRGG